jgi:hypothetical protein
MATGRKHETLMKAFLKKYRHQTPKGAAEAETSCSAQNGLRDGEEMIR